MPYQEAVRRHEDMSRTSSEYLAVQMSSTPLRLSIESTEAHVLVYARSDSDSGSVTSDMLLYLPQPPQRHVAET